MISEPPVFRRGTESSNPFPSSGESCELSILSGTKVEPRLAEGSPCGLTEDLNLDAEEQEAKLWELRAAVSLARMRRDQDRSAEARDLLAPIYGWFTEGFETQDLKEAKALLDELV